MKALYRSALIPHLLRRWRAERGDPAELVARFHLPEKAETEPTLLLEVDHLSGCVDHVAAALGDPHVGLHAAESVPRGYYGLIEFVCRSAPTLEGGFRALCRYERLINEALRFSLTHDEKVAVFEWSGAYLSRLSRHAAEYTLAAIVQLARKLIRVPWPQSHVWFATAAPEDRREVEAFFGTSRIEYGRSSNGFSFDARTLAAPIATTDPQLQQVLRRQAEQELEKQPAPQDFEGQVRQAIRESLGVEGPLLATAAKRLSLTPRTLQRRLSESSASFQDLVDDTRRTLAISYLENKETGIAEIAFRLGYASHAAFTRAFKEWTGKAPAEFRTGHQG